MATESIVFILKKKIAGTADRRHDLAVPLQHLPRQPNLRRRSKLVRGLRLRHRSVPFNRPIFFYAFAFDCADLVSLDSPFFATVFNGCEGVLLVFTDLCLVCYEVHQVLLFFS